MSDDDQTFREGDEVSWRTHGTATQKGTTGDTPAESGAHS